MTNFNELHPRSRSGTFTRQSHSFPDITLDAVLTSNPDPLPVFDTLGGVHREILAYAGGARIRRIVPRSSSDVHDSLNFDCSPTSGFARLIVIRDPLATLDQEIAHGPLAGPPLLVDIQANAGSLTIISGHVVIRHASPFANEVTAGGSSVVTLIVARGCSAEVRATDDASVTVIAEPGAHGVLRIESAAASGTVVGDVNRFRIANIHAWKL